MVRIRLARAGTKNAPVYRIVVADHRFPRGGRFIETLGTFNPRRNDGIFEIQKERLAFWQERGAQVTDTISRLLKKQARELAAKAAG
jgi:small subunit ribosomal protein S16